MRHGKKGKNRIWDSRIQISNMRYSLVLFLVYINAVIVSASPVRVSTQTQFDKVIERINNGEEMHVLLKPGTYVLKKQVMAKAPLTIKGKRSVITCASESFMPGNATKETNDYYIYEIKNKISIFPLFYDNEGKLIPISESVIDSVRVNYIDGEIEAAENYTAGTGLKIPISSNLQHLKNKKFSHAFGYLDSGWRVVNFSIERSDDNFLYCTTVNECTTKNYQYDRIAYKKPVRYVVFNAEIKPECVYYDSDWLYIPKGMGPVYYINRDAADNILPRITTYNDIELSGVQFCGIGGVSIQSGTHNKCNIYKCYFKNCLGTALSINKNNEDSVIPAIVSKCDFENCGVFSGSIVSLRSDIKGQTCICMSNCKLTRHSDAKVIYKNGSGGLYVDGDVLLTDNVIYNTCRAHLYLFRGGIFAKGNYIYNTDEFYIFYDRNTSSDWGLVYCDHIYTDTQNALDNMLNKIVLEGNLLYGAYAYGGDARGIFIDDGRGDVICKDNVVLNTQIYSLDSRNCRLMNASSIRNSYSGNIVSSNYRLAAGKDVTGMNRPSTSANVLFTETPNIVSNSNEFTEDKRLDYDASSSCIEGTIVVSKELFNLLKRSPARRTINRFVKRK